MSEFLSRARERLAGDLLRRVDAGFYFAEYAMQGKNNLETAYGAAVFRQVVSGPGFRVATRVPRFTQASNGPTIGQVVEGFERGIAHLYGQAVLEQRDQWVSYYAEFFDYLLERFRVGVVTTNYDLVVETALQSIGRESTYCTAGAGCGLENPIPILKLHGSVNWPLWADLSLEVVCANAKPQERAFVLPPTWNKDLASNKVLARVWLGAIRLISSAHAVLVIGHSFPSTDLHLDYLYAEGMSKQREQPQHKRVTVADIDVGAALEVCKRFSRYQTVESAVPHRVSFEDILFQLRAGCIALC